MHVSATAVAATVTADAATYAAAAATPVGRVARDARRCCLGRRHRVGRPVAAALPCGDRCRRDDNRDVGRLAAVTGAGPAASGRTAAASVRAPGLRRAAGRLSARLRTSRPAAVLPFDRSSDPGATAAPSFAPVSDHVRLVPASKAFRHETRGRRLRTCRNER